MARTPYWPKLDRPSSEATRDPLIGPGLDPAALATPSIEAAPNWDNQKRLLVADPVTGRVAFGNKWTLGNPNRKRRELIPAAYTDDFTKVGWDGTPVLTDGGGGIVRSNYASPGHYIQFNTSASVGAWGGVRSQHLATEVKWVWDPTVRFYFRMPGDLTGARIWLAATKEELNGKASPIGTPTAGGVSRTAGLLFDNTTNPTTATNIAADAHTAGFGKFTRASGSWLTDGYYVGGRVTSSGFANAGTNGTWFVYSVSATELEVIDGSDAITTEAAEAGQQIASVARTGNFYAAWWDGAPDTAETSVPATASASHALTLEVDSGINQVRWYLYDYLNGTDYGLIHSDTWGTMPTNQVFGIDCVIESRSGDEVSADFGRIIIEHD